MNTRTKIFSASPYRKLYYRFNDCNEQETALTDYLIMAELEDGTQYLLYGVSFEDGAAAERLCDRIMAAGSIDLDLWDYEATRYGSPAWEAEVAEASIWRDMVRRGVIHESEVPDAYHCHL